MANHDLTEIILYRDTPFNNFRNTMFFNSNEERDNFFNDGLAPYPRKRFEKHNCIS